MPTLDLGFLIGILGLTLTLAYGAVSTVSPITIMRLQMLWPRFIFPRTLGWEGTPPKVREAVRLIDEDPKEYARRFRRQLIVIRVCGIYALLLGLVAAVALFIGVIRSVGPMFPGSIR